MPILATLLVLSSFLGTLVILIVSWLRYNSLEVRIKQLEDFHGHQWISQTLYPPKQPR